MKVAIPSRGDGLSASVERQFGRCSSFLFVDTETMKWKVVPNKASDQPGGAGIAAAQQLIDEGAEVVLAGEVGLNAYDVLSNAKIRVYGEVTGTVEDALEMLESGDLETLETRALESKPEAKVPVHQGTRRDGGRGRGRGRGRRGRRARSRLQAENRQEV